MLKYLVMGTIVLACGLSQAAEKDGKFSTANGISESARRVHSCAADALSKALPLLRFHLGDNKCDQLIANEGIDRNVKVVGTTKLLVGRGLVDVLEVTGYIFPATYRMRFLYAKIPGTCSLMGQELFEMSNPY